MIPYIVFIIEKIPTGINLTFYLKKCQKSLLSTSKESLFFWSLILSALDWFVPVSGVCWTGVWGRSTAAGTWWSAGAVTWLNGVDWAYISPWFEFGIVALDGKMKAWPYGVWTICPAMLIGWVIVSMGWVAGWVIIGAVEFDTGNCDSDSS